METVANWTLTNATYTTTTACVGTQYISTTGGTGRVSQTVTVPVGTTDGRIRITTQKSGGNGNFSVVYNGTTVLTGAAGTACVESSAVNLSSALFNGSPHVLEFQNTATATPTDTPADTPTPTDTPTDTPTLSADVCPGIPVDLGTFLAPTIVTGNTGLVVDNYRSDLFVFYQYSGDDSRRCTAYQSELMFKFLPAGTYYIFVDGYGPDWGEFELRMWGTPVVPKAVSLLSHKKTGGPFRRAARVVSSNFRKHRSVDEALGDFEGWQALGMCLLQVAFGDQGKVQVQHSTFRWTPTK